MAASPDSQQQESLAAFDGFTGDLTEYLNGSEALTAFLHNSLRQARTIFTRLEEACGPAIAGPLGNRLHYWTTEAQRGEELVDAFARLDAVPWEPTLAEMRDDVIRITREQCSDLRRKTAEEAEAALARWYDGDGSFAALVHEGLRAVLVECRDAIIEKAAQAATEALGREASGSGLDPQVCADLETVELSLTSVARELGGAVRSVAEDRAVVPDLPTRLIPVRRGFLDWLFLRSQDSMRRRMFGPDNAPTRPVSRVVKQSRLGAGRVVLGEAIRTRIDVFFTETLDRVAREVFGAQVAAISSRMRERVQEVSAHSLDRLEAARVQVQMLEGLRNERDDLLRVLGEAASGLADLEAQCGEPDSDDGESGGSDGEGPGPSLGGSHGGPESGPAPKVRAAAAGVGIGAVGFRIGDPDEMG